VEKTKCLQRQQLFASYCTFRDANLERADGAGVDEDDETEGAESFGSQGTDAGLRS
jgi:hypothetical protein